MKPTDAVVAWNKQSAVDRLQSCKTMLYLHGFLTEAENKRVHERMMKWVAKHRVKK